MSSTLKDEYGEVDETTFRQFGIVLGLNCLFLGTMPHGRYCREEIYVDYVFESDRYGKTNSVFVKNSYLVSNS